MIISLYIVYFFNINKCYKLTIVIFLSKDSLVKILYKYHASFLSFLLYQTEGIISIHPSMFHQTYEMMDGRSIHPLPHPSIHPLPHPSFYPSSIHPLPHPSIHPLPHPSFYPSSTHSSFNPSFVPNKG